MAHTYKVGDFAELTGVTARALHHYERLGLLKPARTDAGYRVYSESDLATLEQIVTLKFLGFRLEQIKSLLRSDPGHFAEVFAAQRWLLEERARRIAVAIRALEDAERSVREQTRPDTSPLSRIIEVLDMKNHVTDAAQYAALLDRKVERLRAMTPEARAEMQREWMALVQDIESAMDEDPASERAQSLATRWLNASRGAQWRRAG